MQSSIAYALGGISAMIVIFVLIALLSTWVLMFAWNAVVPALFHGPSITFFQSVAVVALINVLRGLFSVTVTNKGSQS